MKSWKISLIVGFLLALATCLFLASYASNFSSGIGFMVVIYLIVPIIGFSSALLLCHRKGFFWLYPLAYTLFYILLLRFGQIVIFRMSIDPDWSESAMIAGFAFYPTLIGSGLGGLMHYKGWLKHPILPILTCLALYFIAVYTYNAFPYQIMGDAPKLLYLKIPIIFAIVGLATGFFDNKGYLLPFSLGFFFYVLYSIINGNWLSYLVLIYLALGYLALFLGRFWKNSRAKKQASSSGKSSNLSYRDCA